MDMVCKYNIPDLIAEGELNALTTDLTVKGDLLGDGGRFTGTDMVRILAK